MVGRGESLIEALSFPGTFASSGVLDLATLSENLPDLVADLARFDPFALASKVGALLTEPTMHANTFRLEALIHLGVLHGNGVVKPRQKHLAKWLNDDLAAIAPQEDPPEDIFISNVCDDKGNYRIFEGIWETGDAYLQRVLDLLATLPAESQVHELRRNMRALLGLSDAVAARRGLARYTPGGGTPARPILLPSDERLRRSVRTIAFNKEDLAALGIIPSDLEPFVLHLTGRRVLLSESIGHSTLERRPLLVKGERVVLALPTGTSAALRRFVLEWMNERGLLPSFSEDLRRRDIRAVLDDGMTRFHAEPMGELPPLDGLGHPRFSQAFGTFDLGKFVHILVIHDNVGEILLSGLVSDQSPPSEAMEALGRHVRSASQHFSSRADYTGGLTLMIMGGLGRGCAFGLTDAVPANWHVTGLSLSDFLLLSWEDDMSLLKLWKMKQQTEELHQLGAEFHNLSGYANLYQFWKSQDFHMVPDEFPYWNLERGKLLIVGSDFISDLRQEVRLGYDEHAALLPNETWLRVRRESAYVFFQEIERLPAYVSYDQIVRTKQIYGVVETNVYFWWIVLDQEIPTDRANLAFRLWEAIFKWMIRAAFVIEREMKPFPSRAMVIKVQLEDLQRWLELDLVTLDVTPETPRATYAEEDGIILSLRPGCLYHFFRPENIGERLCLAAIINAVRQATPGADPAISTDQLVDEIVGDDGARFFHVLRADSFRDRLSTVLASLKPNFLTKEDDAWCQLGLAWLGRQPKEEGDVVRGQESCINFLNSLVDAVWKRLRAKLTGVDRLAVVERALENIEALAFDERHWRITARALLALHDDRQDVIRAAHERNGSRNATALASRVLVEMAVCTCASDGGGRKPSRSDFDNLVADVMLIVNLGQYSDAVRQACAPTEIRIVASGRFEMMTDFHRTVLLPRSHDIHGGHFVAAAREYERYFEQVRERRPSADVFEGQFLEAFEAEYGTSIDMAIAFVSALQNHALAKGTYILELEEAELRAIALAETVDTAAVNAILSSFVLPERERWDEAEPQGFRRKDWYPWRYRRRLSLVSRPIVRVTGAGRAVYLICPGLLETGLRNIILRSAEGSLPEDYFLTGQMKTWIGKANNRRGHTFNEFVAERLREAELRARCNVKLSEIAAGTLNENLGDVDVLAWDVATGRVLVIECKDLHEARTVGEVAEQLRRFRGGYDEGRPDELRRHLRRVEWLSENPALLGQLLNIRVDRIRVEPYLMFSNRVPLKYVDGLPLPSQNIITIDEIQTLN